MYVTCIKTYVNKVVTEEYRIYIDSEDNTVMIDSEYILQPIVLKLYKEIYGIISTVKANIHIPTSNIECNK
jgi:hypothetical protein